MWAMIIPLISSILGENGPVGQYFKSKAAQVQADQEFKLATLNAQTKQIEVEGQQILDRLNSTSQDFKQSTFWFIAVPVIITMCPWTSSFAVVMWGNFGLIPEWFQILFVSIYSSIWGLPIAKEYLGGMFKSLGGAIASRREFKIEKIKILNEGVLAEELRKSIYKKGMTQEQWEAEVRAHTLASQ